MIPTWRFLIFLLLITLVTPPSTSTWGLYVYYSMLLALAVAFIRIDGVKIIGDWKGGLIKGLIFFPVFFAALSLIDLIFPAEVPLQKSDITPLVPLIVVIAPVVEELLFRGYVQEYLQQRMKAEWAAILSAILFSLFHPLSLFPQAFVSGVMLSYVRYRYSSIVPAIVVHSLNNALSVFVYYLGG